MASTLIILISFLLAGALVFGLLYLSFMSGFKIPVLFWTLAVILGVPFVVVFILLIGMCSLPASVFIRGYSLAFLSRIRSDIIEPDA